MSKTNTINKLPCAVYCRTSTDENLDQDFNSLHAQKESCDLYIASQRSEGWLPIQDQYDDGGFSGGTLDRPALKRLLRDIESGGVKVVVRAEKQCFLSHARRPHTISASSQNTQTKIQ